MQALETLPFLGLLAAAAIHWLRHPRLWRGNFS